VPAVRRQPFSDFSPRGIDTSGRGPLRLDFAASCLPHPEKAQRGGEDGYYACPDSRSFGVADGVGGYADEGVDPGLFARRLLQLALAAVRSGPLSEAADLPGALAAAATGLVEEQVQGGSTALLGQLNGSSLAILNLGDSGVMLLRPALRTNPGSDQPFLFPRVLFRSSDQTHYFNCPYQLGSSQLPAEKPDLVHVRVRAGDILVAATDGIFDNLFDHQVQAIVARQIGGAWRSGAPVSPQLQGLASSITQQAQSIGEQQDNKDVLTPFALSALSEGLQFRGGKLDDSTVVVGLVCGPENNQAEHKPKLLHNFTAT